MFSSTESLHISIVVIVCMPSVFQNVYKIKYNCPLCRKIMINLTQHWKYLGNLIATTAMPSEY